MSEEHTVGDTYAGTFMKVLDEKRRITIPAKWRFKDDDGENSYLAILVKYGTYNAVRVMPPDMAAELRSKISKIPITNVAKQRALAKFLQNACTFGCDKQGRIMLDESILAKADIKKEVFRPVESRTSRQMARRIPRRRRYRAARRIGYINRRTHMKPNFTENKRTQTAFRQKLFPDLPQINAIFR